jgi:two-component system nitrate/nitrite response regulator NarL
MSSKSIRILIADDHAIFRDGLRKLLESEPEFEVVGDATNGEETLQLVAQLLPDILLLDISMPGMSGLQVIENLRKNKSISSSVRTILLTASVDKSEMVQALIYGVHGIVAKHVASQMLFKAIRGVMAGDLWVTREIVSELIQALRLRQGPVQGTARIYDLTPRERAIIRAVVDGQVNKDIAATFNISEYTVKHHLTRIFDKLGVSNRVELAMFAVNHDLANEPQKQGM